MPTTTGDGGIFPPHFHAILENPHKLNSSLKYTEQQYLGAVRYYSGALDCFAHWCNARGKVLRGVGMTAMDSSSRWPAEFGDIADKLDGAGNQFRLAHIVGGIARFLTLVVPVTVAAIFIAGKLALPAALHWLLLALIPASIAFGYWKFLHALIWKKPAYGQIARWVEMESTQRDIPLNNSLINAVLLAGEMLQLQSGPASGPLADPRKILIPQVLREINGELQSHNLGAVVPWKRQRGPWIKAGAAILSAILMFVLFPGSMAHGLAVLTAPGKFVPRQGLARILNVQPGTETVLAGVPVEFSVKVAVPGNRLVPATLHIKLKSGQNQKLSMVVFGQNNSSYRYLLASAAENFRYMVSVGGTQSHWYHITVLPKVALGSYQIIVTPPAYTHPVKPQTITTLTGQNITADAGSLSVPQGGTVKLVATLDHTLVGSSALLETGDGKVLSTHAADGRSFSITLMALKPLKYDWLINDAGGKSLQRFPTQSSNSGGHFRLGITPDEPPAIHVLVPRRNVFATLGEKLPIEVRATDDYGLTMVRLQLSVNKGALKTIRRWQIPNAENGLPATATTIKMLLPISASHYKTGQVLHYRFTATDNRNISFGQTQLGPQTTSGNLYAIRLQSASMVSANRGLWERLQRRIERMIVRQQAMIVRANGLFALVSVHQAHAIATTVDSGQSGLHNSMVQTARHFPFAHSMAKIQSALALLARTDALAAITRADDLKRVSGTVAVGFIAKKLHRHQLNVLNGLKAMLALAGTHTNPIDSLVSHQGSNIPNRQREMWKQLALALKKLEKQQRGVINTTTKLAQKPIAQYDANDKKMLKEAKATEDKWSKFLNQTLVNTSNLTEQDQANASLKDDVAQMKIDLALAKSALQIKAVKIATPLEQEGLENAKKLTSHIEQWLMQTPDTTKWEMEEPIAQNDVPAPPLPSQLTDMVGKLLEHEEDMTNSMESLGSKWNDSINKGNGWGAVDGPISDMSAQGVTGNQMPKNDEIQGRSGAGREGRASGEMVGATDTRKGGRRTPTRLTGDQFDSGQVKDTSGRPPGGATGGGKMAGYSGEGLEGPAPLGMQKDIKRMAGLQAQLLNQTDRLRLTMRAAGFNNFKLIESAVLMQDAAKAMNAYRYKTALLYQKMAVQSLATAKLLTGAQAHLVMDNTNSRKIKRKLSDSMVGALPEGYRNPVKAYFEKLSQAGQ